VGEFVEHHVSCFAPAAPALDKRVPRDDDRTLPVHLAVEVPSARKAEVLVEGSRVEQDRVSPGQFPLRLPVQQHGRPGGDEEAHLIRDLHAPHPLDPPFVEEEEDVTLEPAAFRLVQPAVVANLPQKKLIPSRGEAPAADPQPAQGPPQRHPGESRDNGRGDQRPCPRERRGGENEETEAEERGKRRVHRHVYFCNRSHGYFQEIRKLISPQRRRERGE
jgi:hypothetical protein